MLTPQEVSERAFPKASFGGYNMAQVDEFLDLLTADYTSLYNENAVLKSKMKVLVEKVEEYRATEDAMRKALMTAQRMADELVKEAEAKKAQILSDAEGEAKERVANIRKQAGDEEFRLSAAQSATAAYVAKVRALHEQELRYLDGLSQLCPDAPVSQADPVEEAVEEIDDNVQRLVAQAMADATAENLKAQAAQEAAEGPEDLSDTAEFPPAPRRRRSLRRSRSTAPAASTSATSSSAGTMRSNKIAEIHWKRPLRRAEGALCAPMTGAC